MNNSISAMSESLNKDKVVIIIPTYNEEEVIEETISQVFKESLDIFDSDIHILIFDSASTDKTQAIVTQLQIDYPSLTLITEDQKSGLGSAYLQAMRYAIEVMQADIIFEFDADLSHQPKYIKPMLEELIHSDCVVGSRYIKGGSIPSNWQFHRKLFSVMGNLISRSVLTWKYKDFTSGFRATRTAFLNKVLPQQFLSNHYAYKLQLFWLLHKAKAKIVEYPIDFVDREKGKSKLPKNSIIDSLKIIFSLRFIELKRYLKMCVVGSIGMIVQIIAYNILRSKLPPFSATQFAVLAAILSNYMLNSHFTFKAQTVKRNKAIQTKRLAGFGLYSISMIFIQSYWVKLGVAYFGEGKLRENLIIGGGILIGSLLNYYIYSRKIWPESRVQISS